MSRRLSLGWIGPRVGRLAWLVALPALGCALFPSPPSAPAPAGPAAGSFEPAPEVYRRADADRVHLLERENERLRADLKDAEAALVELESGLRSSHTQAEAVSSIAEARIQVDRAAGEVPWRTDQIAEARQKLDEANQQLADGRVAAAVFFATRASRIAANVLTEGQRAEHNPAAQYVRSARAKLRTEPKPDAKVVSVLPSGLPIFPEESRGEWLLVRTPSGQVGWVNASLVRGR
jgi:hypothetical protein